MASRWMLDQLRKTIAQLIVQQRATDARPGTAHDQEADSDATYAEALCVHRLLEDHADDIERELASLRADVELTRITNRQRAS